MKNKLIISICILIIILAGLFFYFKPKFNTTNNLTKIQKAENLLTDSLNVKNCNLFPDASSVVKSKDIKGCDCLTENLRAGCRVSVSDDMFYTQAYQQADPSLCDKISYEEERTFCSKTVKDQISSLGKGGSDDLLFTYIFAKNYDEAIKILEDKMKTEQTTVKYPDLLAQSYAEKALTEHKEAEYIPKALAIVEQAKKIEASNPEVYKIEGFVYEVKPDLSKAIESYNQALALDVNYILAYVGRGHAEEMLGNTASALADFNKAAALDTVQKNIYIYSNLCRINLYLNQSEDSIKNCSIVIGSDLASAPAKSEAAQILGNTYSSLEKYDEAMTQYKIAETYNPTDVNLMLSMATTFMSTGDATSAEQYSREALSLDSGKAIAYEKLATALMLQGKYDESISDALKALSMVPSDVSILLNYKKDVNYRIYNVLAEDYKGIGDVTNQKRYEALRDSLI